MRIAYLCALLPAVAASPALADLSSAQKDAVCRIALARINANAPSDYRANGKAGDALVYVSKRTYEYYCEIFGDGAAFTLSSAAWGRLKPTGNLSVEGKCVNIKLYDPGFGLLHELKSCK